MEKRMEIITIRCCKGLGLGNSGPWVEGVLRV